MIPSEAVNEDAFRGKGSASNNLFSIPPDNKTKATQQSSANIDPDLDLYAVLGLRHTASHKDIDLAFKKKASESHPSRNNFNRADTQKKFNELAYAYSILSDSGKRHDYDQMTTHRFGKQEALAQFQQFFKEYGVLPEETEFFKKHYPNRRQSYYEVLGIPRGATDRAIQESFKKLALDWHPVNHPSNPEAEKKFKDICEAFHHLGDRTRRKHYDKVEFPDHNTFQAHAQFNNAFMNGLEFGNEDDRELLGDFVRKTSRKEEISSQNRFSNYQPRSLVEETHQELVSSSGPNGSTSKTITRKSSIIDGRAVEMTKEEVQNPDGTVDVVETFREGDGEAQVRRYVRPSNNVPSLQ